MEIDYSFVDFLPYRDSWNSATILVGRYKCLILIWDAKMGLRPKAAHGTCMAYTLGIVIDVIKMS